MSVVRRREEIRRAVLEERGCIERAGERDGGARELGGNHRNCTAALRGKERVEKRKAGGRRAGRGELTWRDGTESDSRPHLLPQMEQWRIRCIRLLSPPSPSRTELEELPSLQM